MTPQEQAQLLKKEVKTILEKWKIKDPVFHERLLCKDICILITDILINEGTVFYGKYAVDNGREKLHYEVKKILEDEN